MDEELRALEEDDEYGQREFVSDDEDSEDDLEDWGSVRAHLLTLKDDPDEASEDGSDDSDDGDDSDESDEAPPKKRGKRPAPKRGDARGKRGTYFATYTNKQVVHASKSNTNRKRSLSRPSKLPTGNRRFTYHVYLRSSHVAIPTPTRDPLALPCPAPRWTPVERYTVVRTKRRIWGSADAKLESRARCASQATSPRPESGHRGTPSWLQANKSRSAQGREQLIEHGAHHTRSRLRMVCCIVVR